MPIVTPGMEKSEAKSIHKRGQHLYSDREILKLKLGYIPFPKQDEFHGCGAKYRLFGGAAGPGKSKALLYEAIIQAYENAGVEYAPAAANVSQSSNKACCFISGET